ncbi:MULTISPECIES: phage baseplate assembly protein V [Micromonospora]|uniref:Phage-related baseplate assembly protein n=1 Tax=Micromonospora chaiyaphumensis TaxID=307119 RepID=A0A1C4VY29_9ACTN|nr:phage baseplate assembly protein V [Micromonospora chaiyaphumensis]SCE88858.1 Phage-related baseplate assembly protein [Micromonospora chaiyaphumensis]
MTRQFFGVYRGKVEQNVDPMLRGRVQVSVPKVLGDGRLAWAEPCVPYAGNGVGGFNLPPVGAAAWVAFEGGNPDYPVLLGCYWQVGESPAPGLPQQRVFQSDSVSVTVSDLPMVGGLTIEVGPPAVLIPLKVVLGSGGIELSTGATKVVLDGVRVSVNDGALEVM